LDVNDPVTSIATIWPLMVFLLAATGLVIVMIGLSALLGQRHWQRTTGEPFESGMLPTGTARIRFDVKFYLMAMFFVIFDLEAIFIFAWAASVRQLGWFGYIEMLIFVGFLLLALFYLWRVGALEWGTKR